MTIYKTFNKFITGLMLIFLLGLFAGCNNTPKLDVDGLPSKNGSGAKVDQALRISKVDVVANQLVINGTNLESATSVRVTGPMGFDETFDIESRTSNQVIANAQSNLNILVNGLFSLIVSNAMGAATYTISFELQDGQVTAAKLSGMGAAAGDVLTYDGTSWGPAPLTGLSYEGIYDANTATDQTTSTPAAGHYYVVQAAGSVDPDGVTRANTYSTGDWAVYNGATSLWDRVVGSSDVTSVNGQTGVVTLGWADFSKAGSLLSDIANVDVTGRNTGDILVWNGSNWIIQAPPVDTNTNAATLCGVGQVLLGDGSCSLLPVDTNAATLCAAGEYLDGSGSCLPIPAAVNAGTLCSPGQYLDGDGTCKAVPVDTDTNTNAATLCGAGQYLDGDGSCQSVPTPTTSLGADAITSGAGLYFTYRPNNSACSDGQVLKWSTANGRWECGSDAGATGADSSSLRGEDLDPALATNTTTDGQILVWSQTNSRWEVGAVPVDTNTTYTAGTGLGLTGTTFNVDVGTGANQIVQLNGVGELPAVDGSNLTNITADSVAINNITNVAGQYFGYRPSNTACADGDTLVWNGLQGWVCGTLPTTTTSLTIGNITNNAGEYFVYRPNNAACADGQVLKWSTTNSRWECGSDAGAGGADASSLLGEALDASLATNTTTDGQILVWSQTNSRWEVGAAPVDTNTTYTPGTGLSLIGTEFNVNTGTGPNQVVQLNGAGNLPAVDGSALTNVNAATAATADSVNVDNIANGAGLYFTYQPNNTACADGEVLKWVAANSRWECAADGGGSGGETNTAANTGAGAGVFRDKTAAQLNFRSLTSSDSSLTVTENADDIDLTVNQVGYGALTNGAGAYLTYQPNNTACTDGQVLKWSTANTRWECGADAGAGGGDAASLLGEALDPTLATNTTTDGQILVWSQTNSRWEVGSDNDTTYTAGSGINLTGTIFSADAGTGANQLVQLDGSGNLPAVDGSALTNVTASSMDINNVNSGAGLYFTYQPNNVACGDGEVLKWVAANSRWECGVDGGAGGGEANTAANAGTGAGIFRDKTTTQLNFRSIASGDSSLTVTENADDIDLSVNQVGYDALTNAPGTYFTHQPNNVACGDGEVLKWVAANTRWECAADGGGAGSDNLGDHTATTNIQLGANYISSDGDNEGLRVDTTGNVSVGTTPLTPLAKFQVDGNVVAVNDGAVTMGAIAASDTPTVAPSLALVRARGTLASTALPQSGDDMGGIFFMNPEVVNGSRISSFATENHVAASARGADLRFYTVPNGSPGSIERVKITQAGNVGIGTGNPSQRLTVAGNINVTTGNDICIDGGACLSSATAGGGETNTGSNTGAGAQVFKDKTTTQLNFRSLASSDSSISITQNTDDINLAVNSVSVDRLTNGAGQYFTYQPNNTACNDGEVLKWVTANSRWECAVDGGGGGGSYSAGAGIDATALAGNSIAINLLAGTALDFAAGQLGSAWNLTGTDLSYLGGGLGLGVTTPNASALFEMQSTSQGFLPPRMTTTQRDAIATPATGLTIFDTTENKLMYYDGSSWLEVGGEATGPAFRVDRNNSDQTVTLGVSTKMDWTREIFDKTDDFDLTTDRFTPSVAGTYLITMSTWCDTPTSQCTPRIYKNGAMVAVGSLNGSSNAQLGTVSIVVDMNGTTDYIEGWAFNQTGTTVRGLVAHTQMSGGLLGGGGGSGGGGGGSDDLGNHTATQNLVLGANFISGDGDNEGIAVDPATGALMLGEVTSNPGADTGFGKIYVKSSDNKLYFLDSLGTEVDLTAGGGGSAQGIDSAANETAITIDINERVGIGIASPVEALHVHNQDTSQAAFANFSTVDTGGTITDGFIVGYDSSNDAAVVFNKEATPLVFGTSAAARMVIDPTGNVGIGTLTPPQSLLHLQVAIGNDLIQTMGGRAGQDTGLLFKHGASDIGYIGYRNDLGATFDGWQFGGAGQFVLERTSGNVGIGTNVPTSRLEIDSGATDQAGDLTVSSFQAGIQLIDKTSSPQQMNDLRLYNDNGAFNIDSDTDNDGVYDSKLLRMNSSGMLVLGRENPAADLDVYSDGVVNVNIGTAGDSAGDQAVLGLATLDDGSFIGTATNKGWVLFGRGDSFNGTVDNNFGISFWNGTSYKEAFRMSPTGNVGIGTTTNPQTVLNIRDTNTSGSMGVLIEADSGVYGSPRIGFLDLSEGTSTTAPVWYIDNDSDLFRIFRQPNSTTAGTDAISITNTFQVGIGTTTPDQTLSVNGDASKTGGGTWAVFSDARLKTVTGRYVRSLEALRELDPIYFKYNEDNPLGIKDTSEQVGFVAQEVQKVIPEAVEEMDSGYLQLHSDAILWTMLNSIKELDLIFGEQVNKNIAMFERMSGLEEQVKENSRAIASLKEENNEMKKKLDKLESENQMLKSYLCQQDPQAPFCSQK